MSASRVASQIYSSKEAVSYRAAHKPFAITEAKAYARAVMAEQNA